MTFSYSALAQKDASASLCRQVRGAAEEIKTLVLRSHESIIRIGELLAVVKRSLDHGDWEEWLAAEFEWSAATANRFVHTWERFSQVPARAIQHLSRTALYELAAPSTPQGVVDEVVAKAKPVTAKEVRKRRREATSPPAIEPTQKPALLAQLQGFDKVLRELRKELIGIQEQGSLGVAEEGLIDLLGDLQGVRQLLLRRVMPAGPCHDCEGESEGCETCCGTGWLTRSKLKDDQKGWS